MGDEKLVTGDFVLSNTPLTALNTSYQSEFLPNLN